VIAGAVALSFNHVSRRARLYSSQMVFPALFAMIAVGVLTWDHFSSLHEVSVWLSASTLIAVIVRMWISFRENSTLLAALHDDAVTDALTGLGNRRKLIDDLESALERGRRAPDGHVLALYDLDGFKSYNDTYGHAAGDSLLRRLGASLATAVEPAGRAYRLGGDEFCILVPASAGPAAEILEGGREALSEQGEGFRVGASAGGVLLTTEGMTSSDALRLADRRMYSEKRARGGRVHAHPHELLLTILHEREPELTDHHEDVSRLAVAVGREVGLDAEEIDVLRRAAELHDIGKIAIPEEILRKPAPLDEMEWELMRKHTLVGERILATFPSMAPVARLVRSSHECWDGKGYPDGLAGEEIPIGARIIYVCDAFDAMCSERPYSTGRDVNGAIAEIRHHAGAQFDPGLVETLCGVVERGAHADRSADRAESPRAALAGQPAPS
jgi:diguanylate cyclase (GGDEF)-like protein